MGLGDQTVFSVRAVPALTSLQPLIVLFLINGNPRIDTVHTEINVPLLERSASQGKGSSLIKKHSLSDQRDKGL